MRPHGRPRSGAFNVVMATAIVSIACHDAGLEPVSVVLLWLAVLAFIPLAAIDVGQARHPLTLLHRAGDPEHGFPAFGFVADACVLGARLIDGGPAARTSAAILLVCGATVWLVIVVAVIRAQIGGDVSDASGQWLLAVVATDGLAILAEQLASAGYGCGDVARDAGVALWVFGGVLYVVIGGVLIGRLARRRSLRPGELTPDWWILMGAAAIGALAATAVRHAAAVPATAVLGVGGWLLASAWIPVLIGGELWQARRIGVRGSRRPGGRWCSRWACTAPPASTSATRWGLAGSRQRAAGGWRSRSPRGRRWPRARSVTFSSGDPAPLSRDLGV